jgi:MFS family permease
MATVNTRRVLLGALAGGVVWNIWSVIVNTVALRTRYEAAQQSGAFLKQPRYPYPLFIVVWIVMLFVLAYMVAWLYASARSSRGAGPRTAAVIGFLVGFAAGFPTNFATATWAPISRHFPLWWMLELWVGAILAALVAGWLYRDAPVS